jgi:hypothetical protein
MWSKKATPVMESKQLLDFTGVHAMTTTFSLTETTTLYDTTTGTITTTIQLGEEPTVVTRSTSKVTPVRYVPAADTTLPTTTTTLYETETRYGTTTSTLTTTIEIGGEVHGSEATKMPVRITSTPLSKRSKSTRGGKPTTTTTLFETTTLYADDTTTLTTTIQFDVEGSRTTSTAQPKLPTSNVSLKGATWRAKPKTTSTLFSTTTIYIPPTTSTLTTTADIVSSETTTTTPALSPPKLTPVVPYKSHIIDQHVIGTSTKLEYGEDAHINGRDLEEGKVEWCRECRQRHCCRVV